MEEFISINGKRIKTIDALDISDCAKIIKNDLSKAGVSDDDIVDVLLDYFVPLKIRTGKLKNVPTEKWFDITEL